ncbi:MAG: hypothetical protein QXU99_07065 [Candidatus Bathyarchaeia archaeon]
MSRKLLLVVALGYSIAVAVSCALPVDAGGLEWHSFYTFLDEHSAVPYVDVREGYPPLGFLVYKPLYHIFQKNPTAFAYGFRALNGAFLIATLFTFFLIIERQQGEKRAIKLALYYAVLPSVIIANTYSNDVIALLPAALAIYMMIKKKSLACGLLLGLATLGKGFPVLLLFPAIATFKESRERLKLVAATASILVFSSLPFMLINPLTYMSTFTHVGSRGPWETIWAVIDGYFSHGGLLHPLFDKFFYHFNLLKVYSANHYDHAIYAWSVEQLPLILTFLQITSLITISAAFWRKKDDVLPFCGLLYISYMLFFKGYSTQFAVSTPFYLLLATTAVPAPPLLFLIPLEASHILQILSWNAQAFAPEFLRNEHLALLVSAVIIRSIVFTVLIWKAFKNAHAKLRNAIHALTRLSTGIKLVKDKVLVFLVSICIITALICATPVCDYIKTGEGFAAIKGVIDVSCSEWQNITLSDLKQGDQIMIKLNTNVWFDAKLANSTTQIDWGLRNPYNLKGSFNETMLFFVADAETCNVLLRMRHEKMPFRVTEGLEGDLVVNVTEEENGLTFKLRDTGRDGNASVFTIAYPLSTIVDDSFALRLKYRIMEGNKSSAMVYVFDDTDEWVYPFVASEDFVLTCATNDLYGYANLFGDVLSLIEFSITVNDGSLAIFKLEELKVCTAEKSYGVKFYAFPTGNVEYEVFVERDFRPPIAYVIALISIVALGSVAILYLYKKIGNYGCNPKRIIQTNTMNR